MIPLQDFQKRPRVLVAGGGLTAWETAAQVLKLGYEVVLATPAGLVQPVRSLQPSDQALGGYVSGLLEQLKQHSKGWIIEGAQVTAIDGFAGDFQVELAGADRSWNEAVGAIVLAPELSSKGPGSTVPQEASRTGITLDRLAEAFAVPDQAPEAFRSLGPDSYVALVSGLNGSGGLAEMAQALSGALKIREEIGSQVYFFTGNIKVAEEGLERLYLACRDAGVVFFKFEEEQPEFLVRNERPIIRFVDPLVGRSLELGPDLLITEEVHVLPEKMQALAEEARLGLDRSGFLQPANIHLLPYQTMREGIFTAGPGKGPLTPPSALEEARGAALAVHHFFQGREVEPGDREVVVDKGLCTVCLTCLRFCPHQAIGWTHRVFIHPLACRRCGICASECPMDAIQIAGYSDAEVENRLAEIGTRWGEPAASGLRIVIFGCQRSAGTAWEQAQSAERQELDAKKPTLSEVEFIGLPCAGKLDTDALLKALTQGADGVLVLACPEENCRSQQGNTYARRRLGEARDYLEEAGLDPGRLRFAALSSNMVHKMHEIIDRFVEDLKR
ncbi:MAG: hydrogenase iron-sulfur subunit [Deltaproteobacteria bacterium]|nr:hydrogenase iron-sulfur subunit [Deltaproteobacteria bacterium]